jgi:resorcinol 4-hydroxylase (FADH2)
MNSTAAPAVAQTAPRPTLDDLAERARTFQPLLRKKALETEANRRVSPEVVAQLAEAGLLSMVKPARFDGMEYGPTAMVRLGYELGQACGSTAWCAALVNCNNWFASYWPLDVQQEVWGDGIGNLIAAPLAPTGQCEVVDGGYRLSGRWPFASNCENSQWAIISAIVPEADGQPSGPGWFLTPIDPLHIDQDTWHVSGLAGTGSKTLYTEEPVFVPARRLVRLSDIVGVTTPGTSIPDNPLAGFGWTTFGGAALVAPLLGMARGALDWYGEYMRSKIRPGATSTAAHNPHNQVRAGRASADIDAALALLLNTLESAEQVVFGGGRLDTETRVAVRRAIGYAASQSVQAVNTLAEAAGASSTDLSLPLQRHWRDVNAGARHVSLDEPGIMSMVGQQLFGLTPTGAF